MRHRRGLVRVRGRRVRQAVRKLTFPSCEFDELQSVSLVIGCRRVSGTVHSGSSSGFLFQAVVGRALAFGRDLMNIYLRVGLPAVLHFYVMYMLFGDTAMYILLGTGTLMVTREGGGWEWCEPGRRTGHMDTVMIRGQEI